MHPTNSKAKGIKISWETYKIIKRRDHGFILGWLMCKQCLVKLHLLEDEDSNIDIEDEDYNTSVSMIDDDEKRIRREKLDKLTDIFKIDRVRYQLTSYVSDVSNTTLNYFRNIHRQLAEKLTDVFCSLVAPGLEQEMKKVVEDTSVEKSDSYSTTTLLHLKESFKSCYTKQARTSVLTLVPKQYSKVEVSGLFGCTIYEITKARSIIKRYGACEVEQKERKIYSRLSLEKSKHFINFLFTTELLQEVAYGTTSLKLDGGEKLTISNTILNGLHEHAIREYKIYCEELNYEPLGRTKTVRCRLFCSGRCRGIRSKSDFNLVSLSASLDLTMSLHLFYLGATELFEVVGR